MPSNLNFVGAFSVLLQSNRKFYHIYTVTTVIHRSHNLIGTQGLKESRSLGLNRDSLIEAILSSQRAQGNKRLLVISLRVFLQEISDIHGKE